MSVSNGPKLGTMISASTGDSFDADFRKFLRQYHALLQCSVKSKTLTAPPGSPANGDAYIVGASATGAWSGHDKAIAIWTTDNPITPSGLWEFYAATKGFRAFNEADSTLYAYDGTTWSAITGGGGGGAVSSVAGRTGAVVLAESDVAGLASDLAALFASGGPWATSTRRTGTIVAGQDAALAAWTNFGTVGCMGLNMVFFSGTSLAASVIAGASRGAANHMQGSTVDTLVGIWNYTYLIWRMGQKIQFMASGYMGQITDVRMWVGLFNPLSGSTAGFLGGSDTPSTTYNYNAIAFRFSQVGGDVNFQCYVGNGTTETVVDSGVPGDTNSHRFAFVCDDSIPNVKFYIDGVLVATITTHLPAPGTNLGHAYGSSFHTGSQSDLYISTLQVQSDF